MAKFQKLPTIVEAWIAAESYPDLGATAGDDYVIRTADNILHCMPTADFESKYSQVSESSTLTGSDWE